MSAALEQIDALLSAWDERLRRMDENLVALEGDHAHQLLASRRASLAGLTKQRAEPALDAIAELFENRARLAAVVDRAKAVRAAISPLTFWESDTKMGEILRLLRGPSIDLGQRPIALADRSLLDEAHQDVRVAPEQLLAEMVSRFEEARRTVLAVAGAWRALEPELAQLGQELASLRRIAAEIEPPAGPFAAVLAALEAELAGLQARAANDPLGVEGARRTIATQLAALAARLGAAADARTRVLEAIAEARELMRRLTDDHARALAASDRARRDLAGESVARLPRPLDEGQVRGFEEWLRKLEDTVRAERWSSADVGLARFREAIRREHAAEAAALAAAEALLDRAAELAGRLSARRAQAAALAARGLALPDPATAHALEADAILRRRPLPIDDLARAVEAYEAAVVALARK